jgi:hypothetical protein
LKVWPRFGGAIFLSEPKFERRLKPALAFHLLRELEPKPGDPVKERQLVRVVRPQSKSSTLFRLQAALAGRQETAAKGSHVSGGLDWRASRPAGCWRSPIAAFFLPAGDHARCEETQFKRQAENLICAEGCNCEPLVSDYRWH